MSGRVFAICALVAIAALLVVGAVSGGVVRHIIQTAPLWIIVVLGLINSPLTKWAAFPMFLVWLIIMGFIWLFLLRIANVITGTYSPVEIAMTIAVGAGSLWAVFRFWTGRTSVPAVAATATLIGAAALQIAAIYVSLQPPFADDASFSAWISNRN